MSNVVIFCAYAVDPEFKKGLSITGKAGSLGGESDYRPELKAIANKLHMWIVFDYSGAL